MPDALSQKEFLELMEKFKKYMIDYEQEQSEEREHLNLLRKLSDDSNLLREDIIRISHELAEYKSPQNMQLLIEEIEETQEELKTLHRELESLKKDEKKDLRISKVMEKDLVFVEKALKKLTHFLNKANVPVKKKRT